MSRIWVVQEWTPEDALDNPGVESYTITIYDYGIQDQEAREHAERACADLFEAEIEPMDGGGQKIILGDAVKRSVLAGGPL